MDDFAKVIMPLLPVAAEDGLLEYKRIMAEKIPQGESPADNGVWVNTYSKKYANRKRKPLSPVDLDDGLRRYLRDFKKSVQDIAGVEFDFGAYSRIADVHQSGEYAPGVVKPRQILPESVDQIPQRVLNAIKDSICR